ncbi:MAG: ATP phosphoribosyltransferase [Chloroflexota bacterium]|nr:ATP phosphoribosyltransferase [Chloroflexota bacterium]
MKLALPKGKLQKDTAALLDKAGFGLDDYNERSRSYRLKSSRFPDMFIKVFRERDIPIQVAIGNYDIGICGLDWMGELMAKYPTSDVMKLKDLGYGGFDLCAVAGRNSGLASAKDLNNCFEKVRIVSEYQNIAEAFALKYRLRRFSILPVLGAGEVYPPESADVAIIPKMTAKKLAHFDLTPIADIITCGACLIANKNSLSKVDLSKLLSSLQPYITDAPVTDEMKIKERLVKKDAASCAEVADVGNVRLALPDGHLMKSTAELLDRTGLGIEGYSGDSLTHRPTIDIPGVTIKMIRPQDMPLQVANGNFDLAITGEDWLLDQLYRFPSSPVEKVLKLGFARVTIVAVVHGEFPAADIHDLKDIVGKGASPQMRVASEYVNIADKYARDNRLVGCRIIPTWGASEAFLPEDADLLIENTETGATLRKNNLKIIDTLLESTSCLIGHRDALADPRKKDRISHLVKAIEDAIK